MAENCTEISISSCFRLLLSCVTQESIITAHNELLNVVFGTVCDFFVYIWNISGTAERICAKFTRKMCLVLRWDEFEGQGQFWQPACGLCLEKHLCSSGVIFFTKMLLYVDRRLTGLDDAQILLLCLPYPCFIVTLLSAEYPCWIHAAVDDAQIQRLLQDADKRDFQIETLKDQHNEGQKREENLKRQVDRLTYDNNSLQADLTSSRDELDEARQSANVRHAYRAVHTKGSLICIVLYYEVLISKVLWYGTVLTRDHTVLPATHMFIHKWNEYLPLHLSRRASLHFGWYLFCVLLRLGGWVGLGGFVKYWGGLSARRWSPIPVSVAAAGNRTCLRPWSSESNTLTTRRPSHLLDYVVTHVYSHMFTVMELIESNDNIQTVCADPLWTLS